MPVAVATAVESRAPSTGVRHAPDKDASCHVCPGESQPISRAVHLSRLAACYSACRNCLHAGDAGALLVPRVESRAGESRFRPAADWFTADGIRGVSLNEITRAAAEALAMSFASLLWDRLDRPARDHVDFDAVEPAEQLRPSVVLARDERPASAEIAAGVLKGLRRMGCRVIDLSLADRPEVDFAVYHLRASGGLHVTGAGCPGAWVGLDAVDADGGAWSRGGRLDQWRTRREEVIGRPTRREGPLETASLATAHRAELQRLLHGLQDVRFGLLTAHKGFEVRAAATLRDYPGSLIPLQSPTTTAGATHESTRDARRQLASAIQSQDLSAAVRVDEDSRRITLFDRLGREVEPGHWLVRLCEFLSRRRGERTVVVSPEVPAVVRGRLQAHGLHILVSAAGEEGLARELVRSKGLLAADGCGRIWFADHFPQCDALATMIWLMRYAASDPTATKSWSV
jgi:hypothetical protein